MGYGCPTVCQHNPCGPGHSCRPHGELYNCTAVAMTAQEETLQPGIIVVIVLSIILVVAIVVIFVLFQTRRGWFKGCLPVKKERESAGGECEGGKKSEDKVVANDGALQKRGSLRYADNTQLEEMIIRNHIAEELAGQKTTSLSVHPDLIGSNFAQLSPTHFADGTMIIENLDHSRGMGSEGVPEHYDLENASSIAASDSDVIQHYQRFRGDSKPHPHRSNHHHHHHQRNGPDRYNHSQNVCEGQSPVSMLSAPSRPSPPLPPGMGQSTRPASALATVHQSPFSARGIIGAPSSVPLQQHAPYDARDSPGVNATGAVSRSQNNTSALSLGSHHSHSSSSTSTSPSLLPQQPNGHGPRHRHLSPDVLRYPPLRGLTVDEVNRLNARANLKNTASLLEAVTSSAGGGPHLHPSHFPHPHPAHPLPSPHLQQHPAEGPAPEVLLEAPDSSSDNDSGANDSFTCSEFEYDSERGGLGGGGGGPRGGDASRQLFSRLPDVAEVDVSVTPLSDHNSYGESAAEDSSGSGGVCASDTGVPLGARGGVGGVFGGVHALDLDGVLNLGPHFHKLVGGVHRHRSATGYRAKGKNSATTTATTTSATTLHQPS